MTLTRAVTAISLKMISILPKVYLRVDLVSDCYFENFIKAADRAKRDSATKSKGPRGFSNFLLNKENKTRMIDLLF